VTTPDGLLDAFDAAWANSEDQSVSVPRIQDFRLPADHPLEVEHFENLVEIDLEYRWRRAFIQFSGCDDCITLPSLADYVTDSADPHATAVFSPAPVAEAYQLALRYGQQTTPTDYLPFAKDRQMATQLLSEIDAARWVRHAAKTLEAATTDHRGLPSLPDFEFESVVGRGGKGIVYKARQISIDRTVAVKTLRSTSDATPNDIRRLRNEAQILGRLQHPNIVTVHSLEHVDDQWFLIMEYVSGSDLSIRRQNGKVSVRDAAQYMQVVANAIQVAHEHNILHRDIKPSNILLDESGVIRVTDFGLSRRLQKTGNSGPLTATMEVLGTPGYISPEQARGQSRELDARADVYGIGATLYSLLVGIAPFTGQDVISILQQVCERIPTPPRMLQPDIPRDLQTICMKCLEKRPSDRYPTAKAVADDLERFLRGEPILARPASLFHRSMRWCQRNVALALLLCSVIVLTIALTGVFVVRSLENAATLATTTQQKRELQNTLDRERATNEELQDNQIRLARLEYDANELGNLKRILELLKPTYNEQDGPPWEWKYLSGLLNDSKYHWDMAIRDAEWIGALAYSLNGNLIAIGNRAPGFDTTQPGVRGRITIRDTLTGDIKMETRDVMSIVDLQFTDDATVLIAIELDMGVGKNGFEYGPGTIRRWNTESWTELPPMRSDISLIRAYPVSERILAISHPTPGEMMMELRLFDAKNPDSMTIFSKWQASAGFAGFVIEKEDGTSEEVHVTRVDLLPTGILHGNRLEVSETRAGLKSKSTVSAFRKPGRELLRTLDLRFVETMALDRAERQLAIATNRGEIRVWDTETWIDLPPFRSHLQRIKSLAFSPDGRKLASGDWEGTVRIWDLSKPAGGVDSGTPTRDTAVESFALNKDGHLVSLIFNKPLEVFEPGSATPLRSVDIPFPEKRASPGRLFDLNFDGTLMAVASAQDNTVVDIRSATTGEISSSLPAHGTKVSFVKFFENSIGTAAWKSRILATPLPEDGEIRLSDLNGRELFLVKVEAARVHRLSLSSDHAIIAASCEQFTETGDSRCFVRAWNVETGEQIDEFPMSDWILGLEFSPANHLLAAIAFKTGDLTLRDVIRGITVADKPDSAPEIQDFCFSPDGQRLAGVTRRQLILWNCKTLRQAFDLPLRQFEGDPAYNARVRFSADGNTIIANQADGTMRSWRVP